MRMLSLMAACALGAGCCAAQITHTTQTTTWQKSDMTFFTMELGSGKVVKGAPYSAQSISEFEQKLVDGNRIFRSNSGMVYRDSEGRTRREQAMGGMGLFGPAVQGPPMISITDPVAGFTYTLNPQDKTATKTPLPPEHATTVAGGGPVAGLVARTGGGGGGGVSTSTMVVSGGIGGGVVHVGSAKPANITTESLGTKSFDAVVAEGTRTVAAIPAGQIGNERPIESVTERWFSQQLQVTVFSQYSDPRTGTTTERLSGISLAEPPHSLFEIPADYTVRDGANKWIMVQPAHK